MKNIFIKIIALVCILASCMSLFSCSFFLPKDDEEPENTFPKDKAETLVKISINPSVEMTLDENGVVLSIYGINEDGRILIYGEQDKIIGTMYEEATEYIVTLAAELGYLDEETGTINTEVLAEDPLAVEYIRQKVNEKIENTAREIGIDVEANENQLAGITLEYDEFRERYKDDPEIQQLTISKFTLAKTASERDGMSLYVACKLTTGELLYIIGSAHTSLEVYATEEYLEMKSWVLEEVAEYMSLMNNFAYATVYKTNIFKYQATRYYGEIYALTRTFGVMYGVYYGLIKTMYSSVDVEVGEDILQNIADQLSLDSVQILKNEVCNFDGSVNVNKMIEYCEKIITEKNLTETGTIMRLLSTLKEMQKAEVENEMKDIWQEMLPEMEIKLSQIDMNILETSAAPCIPHMNEEQKAIYEELKGPINDMTSGFLPLIRGEKTPDEIIVLYDECQMTSYKILKLMEEDLSESDLKRVETEKKNIDALIRIALAQMFDQLDEAQTKAQNYIEQKRAELIEQNKNN